MFADVFSKALTYLPALTMPPLETALKYAGVAFASSATTFVIASCRFFREGVSEAMAASVLKQMEQADKEVAAADAAASTTATESDQFEKLASEVDRETQIRHKRLLTNRAFFVHCARDEVIVKRVQELGKAYPWPAKKEAADAVNKKD